VDNANIKTTWYSLDAQGNVMATYTQTGASPTATVLDEFALYGASRLGTQDIGTTLATTPNFNYIAANGDRASQVNAITASSFTATQSIQYKLNGVALNNAYSWSGTKTLTENVRDLIAAINLQTVTTDVSASLWYSNNASGTYYIRFAYGQPGNHLIGLSAKTFINTVENNTSPYQPLRAMGYGTMRGSDIVGQKRYELSNHLNNVLEVISDQKWATDNGQYNLTTGAQTTSTPDGIADYYLPVIIEYTDYDPYGTVQDNRKGSTSEYRYGFNGQEEDQEVKSEGNSYDFGARMYDPRLGKFLSIDPKFKDYPFMSPYCYAANNPVSFMDKNGEGPIVGWHVRSMAKNDETKTYTIEYDISVYREILLVNLSTLNLTREEGEKIARSMADKYSASDFSTTIPADVAEYEMLTFIIRQQYGHIPDDYKLEFKVNVNFSAKGGYTTSDPTSINNNSLLVGMVDHISDAEAGLSVGRGAVIVDKMYISPINMELESGEVLTGYQVSNHEILHEDGAEDTYTKQYKGCGIMGLAGQDFSLCNETKQDIAIRLLRGARAGHNILMEKKTIDGYTAKTGKEWYQNEVESGKTPYGSIHIDPDPKKTNGEVLNELAN
jgi:RHS repeat-associated protein